MAAWLIPTLMALFTFGLWGLFSKMSILHIDSKSALFFQSIGTFLIGLITLAFVQFKPSLEWKGVTFGLLTGLCLGAGCLFYLFAIDRGKSSTIIVVTSLYPLITIILSVLVLHEGIQLRQACGIFFALLALYLLA